MGRLTEQEADALANAIENAAIDFVPAVDNEIPDELRRGPGRPSLSATGATSPQVRIRVSEQTRSQLERRAQAEGRTVSELARDAIDQYLERTA